jgi:hypothetical protein
MMTPEPRPPEERPRCGVSTRTTAGPILSTTAAIPWDNVSSRSIAAAFGAAFDASWADPAVAGSPARPSSAEGMSGCMSNMSVM